MFFLLPATFEIKLALVLVHVDPYMIILKILIQLSVVFLQLSLRLKLSNVYDFVFPAYTNLCLKEWVWRTSLTVLSVLLKVGCKAGGMLWPLPIARLKIWQLSCSKLGQSKRTQSWSSRKPWRLHGRPMKKFSSKSLAFFQEKLQLETKWNVVSSGILSMTESAAVLRKGPLKWFLLCQPFSSLPTRCEADHFNSFIVLCKSACLSLLLWELLSTCARHRGSVSVSYEWFSLSFYPWQSYGNRVFAFVIAW